MDKDRADKDNSRQYDRIMKNTGLFGVIQGLMLVINIVRNKFVAKLIGTAGFGINESFNRSLNFIKSTTDLGLPFSAVRSVSECMEDDRAGQLAESILVTRTWAFITALSGALLCVLLSGVFSLWAFDGDRLYTLSFMLLSPSVFFSAITGGEMAILKGLRLLRQIAVSQLAVAILTCCISIPLFFHYGVKGLVPSIVLVSLATAVVTCCYSFKAFPYRISPFSKSVIRKGFGMIRIGVYFMVTSFFSSGAFAIIANWLMNNGNADVTGKYGAGYQMVAWLGMFVFAAMESDYFPRLSSVNGDNARVTEMVNSQAEVALLLMSPMVVGFIVFLGPIVHILLTEKFMDAVPMASLAAINLIFKSMTQPMAYIALAKGDSRTFLLQELLYDAFFVAAVILAYKWGGLDMTGLAITVAAVFDIVSVGTITGKRYGFRFSGQVLKMLLLQVPVVCLALFSAMCLDGPWRWIAGCAMLAASAWISIYMLGKYSDYLSVLKQKIRNKLRL